MSGIHYETPESTVKEELLNVSKELQDGLLQFKPANATKNNLEKLLKEKKQEKLLAFTLRLQELLVSSMKAAISYYLMFVFYMRTWKPCNVGRFYAII